MKRTASRQITVVNSAVGRLRDDPVEHLTLAPGRE